MGRSCLPFSQPSPPPTRPGTGLWPPLYTIETKKLSYARQSLNDELSKLFLFHCKGQKISSLRHIIKNVSLEAKPWEITALAGPSGAGKTTLLEILAGKISPKRFSGQVLVNHKPMNPDIFRRLSGYVTQDDALFPHLTVEETLTYSALLRLPNGTRSLAHQKVNLLMKELGLDHIARSRIGEGSKYGISGGERRRISIGVELVHDPNILLIHEPTSGLDSSSAYWLVGLRPDWDGFLYFILVVWIVVLMSNSFTACFSALVPNFITGTSIISGLMGAFFLFSGYFIAKKNIPCYWIFMHYLSLFKYPFESLLINEYGGKGGGKCLENNVGGECVLFGQEYLRQQGLKESQKWSNLGVMLCFVLGYRVIFFFILWCRSYGIRK
ncbi:hypothetical protein OROMI_019847 [Orobanche minor]